MLLTEERALHVAAFVALIDATLQPDGDTLLPRRASEALLARLSATGIGTVTSTPDTLRLTLFGITATSDGSAWGLLRNWQTIARDRLAPGVLR
jgi:hypothetical protein